VISSDEPYIQIDQAQHDAAFTAANEGSFTRQPLGALLKTYAEVGNAEQYLFFFS